MPETIDNIANTDYVLIEKNGCVKKLALNDLAQALSLPIFFDKTQIKDSDTAFVLITNNKAELYVRNNIGLLLKISGGISDGTQTSITSEWEVNLPGNPMGVNGVKANKGQQIEDFLKSILQKSASAVYIAPIATITGTPTTGYEIGQIVSVTVTGSYQQNDGGTLIYSRMFKNGIKVADAATYSENIKMSSSPVNFYYEADYAAGSVKNDNLGNPSPAGQIQSGTVSSPSLSYVGGLRTFLGMIGTLPSTGNEIRSTLINSSILNGGTSYTIITDGVSKNMIIALPNKKKITFAQNTNTNETLSFVLNGITSVPDAAGNQQSYTVYTLTTATPFGEGNKIVITTT